MTKTTTKKREVKDFDKFERIFARSEEERRTLETKTDFMSQFHDLRKLNRGGEGIIFYAETKEGTKVALKKYRDSLEKVEGWERWDQGERDAARELGFLLQAERDEIVNVPRVIDSGTTGFTEDPVIALEYIEGFNLEERIGKGGLSNVERAIEIAKEVAKPLKYAHKMFDHNGVREAFVHRDVKPANIMIDNEGNVKLIDWSKVRDIGNSMSNTKHVSLNYSAPEVIVGGKVFPSTDVYGLGQTLKAYFAGTEMMETFNGKIPLEVFEEKEVPEHIISALKKATEENPKLRYQTIDDFVDALEEKVEDDESGSNFYNTPGNKIGEGDITWTVPKKESSNQSPQGNIFESISRKLSAGLSFLLTSTVIIGGGGFGLNYIIDKISGTGKVGTPKIKVTNEGFTLDDTDYGNTIVSYEFLDNSGNFCRIKEGKRIITDVNCDSTVERIDICENKVSGNGQGVIVTSKGCNLELQFEKKGDIIIKRDVSGETYDNAIHKEFLDYNNHVSVTYTKYGIERRILEWKAKHLEDGVLGEEGIILTPDGFMIKDLYDVHPALNKANFVYENIGGTEMCDLNGFYSAGREQNFRDNNCNGVDDVVMKEGKDLPKYVTTDKRILDMGNHLLGLVKNGKNIPKKIDAYKRIRSGKAIRTEFKNDSNK